MRLNPFLQDQIVKAQKIIDEIPPERMFDYLTDPQGEIMTAMFDGELHDDDPELEVELEDSDMEDEIDDDIESEDDDDDWDDDWQEDEDD
jgi:hypothetical protein